MIRSDFHTHTCYCDGKNTPEEMVLSAIEKGLVSYGFSGHSFAPYDADCCMSFEGSLNYRREISALKDKYQGRINIYCGVEQDIYAPLPDEPYDYTIGSVHYLFAAGECLAVDYTPQILKAACAGYFGGDIYSMAEAYFEAVSSVFEETNCDIIGHFDLISKFNEGGKLFDPENERYVRAWKAAADELLKCGKPFEINVGAISRGYRSEPYPSLEMMLYIASKGGRFVLSSDAHSRENIAFQFDIWEQRLLSEGIRIEEFRPVQVYNL